MITTKKEVGFFKIIKEEDVNYGSVYFTGPVKSKDAPFYTEDGNYNYDYLTDKIYRKKANELFHKYVSELFEKYILHPYLDKYFDEWFDMWDQIKKDTEEGMSVERNIYDEDRFVICKVKQYEDMALVEYFRKETNETYNVLDSMNVKDIEQYLKARKTRNKETGE